MTTIPARPTVYQGISMRSRLEARYAAWLDNLGYAIWEYEPRAYAGPSGQYLPDFEVFEELESGSRHLFVEVKGDLTLADLYSTAKRMAVIWESDPNAILELYVDSASLLVHGINLDGSHWWQICHQTLEPSA